MKVILKGVHLSLTERMKVYVQEHLVEAVTRFYDDEAAELNIHLVDTNGPNKGGTDKECRVTAFVPGLVPIHITEATDDIFQSIDFAKDRLVKALKREQERRRGSSQTGPREREERQYANALGVSIPEGMPVE
ncbi:MAG TPA: HPF/RaiA family ribosome-associated protein [Longimicrobium sp.]|nr:HPF/RaiA family ribosome-associated protein [Longimicrobium sp.]